VLKNATRWRAADQIRIEIPLKEAGHPADHTVDRDWETVHTVGPLTHWGGRTPHGAMPLVVGDASQLLLKRTCADGSPLNTWLFARDQHLLIHGGEVGCPLGGAGAGTLAQLSHVFHPGPALGL
jgi:hypothetical protein